MAPKPKNAPKGKFVNNRTAAAASPYKPQPLQRGASTEQTKQDNTLPRVDRCVGAGISLHKKNFHTTFLPRN